MSDQTLRGRFVWHELTTPDVAAARGFYTKVLGWALQPYEADPSYVMFVTASGALGGAVSAQDTPPHWLPLIGTPDIEATVREATGLGASVVKEITPAGSGHYAVLTDPQGATFGVYGPADAQPEQTPAKRGEFSWHELATTDAAAALDFYAALFGWSKMGEHDMGPEGAYITFGHNGLEFGGVYRKPASMEGPPAWLGYVRVKNVNDVVNKVKKSGGTLINGPMEVPGGDWIAQFLDPQGAMFAVHALKVDMESPASASEPAQSDSLAETTVLTDISPEEARIRHASQTRRKQAPAKKAPAKKGPAKKAPAKKKAASKSAARRSAARKGPARKASGKATRKVARKAARKVARKAAVRKGKTSRRSAARSAKHAPRRAVKRKTARKTK